MSESKELATVKDSELAQPGIVGEILTPKLPFIPTIRIKSPGSQGINGQPGDWIYMGDKDLGDTVKVLIGPWRLAGRHFTGIGQAPEKQAYNRTKEATVKQNQDGQWVWNYPVNSKLFNSIRQKATKAYDKGADRHMVGLDVLFYLPDHNLWAIYFIARQALNQPNVSKDLIRYANQVGFMGTTRGPGQFHYYVPTFKLSTEEMAWPSDAPNMFELFLETPIEVGEDEEEESVER